MKHEEAGRLVYLTVIAGRRQKDALLTMLSAAGARLTTTLYGRGSVEASYLRDMLGLVPEEAKVVITSVMTQERADTVLQRLTEQFHFDKPNTGIAFTIPIDRLSF